MYLEFLFGTSSLSCFWSPPRSASAGKCILTGKIIDNQHPTLFKDLNCYPLAKWRLLKGMNLVPFNEWQPNVIRYGLFFELRSLVKAFHLFFIQVLISRPIVHFINKASNIKERLPMVLGTITILGNNSIQVYFRYLKWILKSRGTLVLTMEE